MIAKRAYAIPADVAAKKLMLSTLLVVTVECMSDTRGRHVPKRWDTRLTTGYIQAGEIGVSCSQPDSDPPSYQ